jgi:hypothetical protein
MGPTGPAPVGECPEGECVRGITEGGGLICEPCGGAPCDPATTTQIGVWCVDNQFRPAKTFENASAECHALGKVICPVEALMLCDALDSVIGDQAQCTILTDSTNTRLWTLTYDAAYGENVFQGIVTYTGDNRALQANVSGSFPFFCCEPAGGR